MKNDYVAEFGKHSAIIEAEQKQTRLDVIGKYKACRKSKGITQTELARRTGISQPNITRFESGNYNPSLEMMVRMAAALDMTLNVKLEKSKEA